MQGKIQKIVFIALVTLIPTLLLWMPFFLRISPFWSIPLPTNGLATIVANYDGPLYLVVAKTFYNKSLIESGFQFNLPTEYYAAHFPLFPILIKLLGVFTNYPYAMLAISVLSGMLAIYFFHLLISEYSEGLDAYFLTLMFAIFPARWLIVRSVGSADPLFIAGIIASVYYFKNKNYLMAGIWGMIAQYTKSPAILLFIAYSIYFVIPLIKNKIISGKKIIHNLNFRKTFPLMLIPAGLLGVFAVFYLTQGDFWAYFKSGDNIHLFFPPFQIFNYAAAWVGTFWQEEIIFTYLIMFIGVYRLFSKKEYEMAVFSAVLFTVSLFIAHRDLLRYMLPIVPFMYVAYSDVLIKREFKFALAIITIPIYLFSIAFISQNVMPVSNWAPFL